MQTVISSTSSRHQISEENRSRRNAARKGAATGALHATRCLARQSMPENRNVKTRGAARKSGVHFWQQHGAGQARQGRDQGKGRLGQRKQGENSVGMKRDDGRQQSLAAARSRMKGSNVRVSDTLRRRGPAGFCVVDAQCQVREGGWEAIRLPVGWPWLRWHPLQGCHWGRCR